MFSFLSALIAGLLRIFRSLWSSKALHRLQGFMLFEVRRFSNAINQNSRAS